MIEQARRKQAPGGTAPGRTLLSIEALKDIRMIVNNGKVVFNKVD